jgi:hypothetical protein
LYRIVDRTSRLEYYRRQDAGELTMMDDTPEPQHSLPSEANPSSGQIFSLGYGHRSLEGLVEILRRYQICWIIDVRSQPRSRRIEFCRNAIESHLREAEIGYLFLGHQLGGRTSVDRLLDGEGNPDYDLIELTGPFQEGLERLKKGILDGHRMALMCGELDANRCHRSRLIGRALLRYSIDVLHIGADAEVLVPQSDSILKPPPPTDDLPDPSPLFTHP